MEFCEFIEKFQTLIVGVFGFSGVIFTLYMNSRLSRQQHERAINHERKSLKVALHSEMVLIRDILSNRCEMTEEKDEPSSAYYPTEIATDVYKQFISKIGLLENSEIKEILEAYALLADLPKRLQFLSSEQDQTTYIKGYIYINADKSHHAIELHKVIMKRIETAINTLRLVDSV